MLRVLLLSRYVLLDAKRGGLHWIFTCAALAAITLGWFLAQLGVTENLDIQLATTASTLRLAFVFIAAIWICTHIVREKQDQSIHLLLTLPVRRSEFVFGKLLAVGLISLIAAIMAAITLAFIKLDHQLIMWSSSLCFELWLVGVFALLCSASMKNVTQAFTVITAFYFLSRSISAMVLMANTTLSTSSNGPDSVMAWVVKTIAYVLPPLDLFTNSAWLIHQSISAATWLNLLVQAFIYTLLLCVIAIWDIEKKQL